MLFILITINSSKKEKKYRVIIYLKKEIQNFTCTITVLWENTEDDNIIYLHLVVEIKNKKLKFLFFYEIKNSVFFVI